jgi:hypothetical protein
MANDLLYEASLQLGASPQNKRSSLLYKIPTVRNRQHNGHGAPRRGIENVFTPERADNSRFDAHKRSFSFLLPILTRTYDSFSVKCRFTLDIENGESFHGWRSRIYRLICPSGFGVDGERLTIALVIAALGETAEKFLLSDVDPARSDPASAVKDLGCIGSWGRE